MDPAAASTGVIRVGTCSWTGKGLVESGAFYPPGIASAQERLKFYASHFDTVEVDSSYYALPTRQMTHAWNERTPDNFLFHVKAYGALTGHSIDPRFLPEELREQFSPKDLDTDALHVSDPAILKALARDLVAALHPLKVAHKLGFIIFQFPPWFTCKKANRDYILYCKELVEGLPIAVEFRHGSWLTHAHFENTLSFLREHSITYIACDEPQYGTLATAPFRPDLSTSIAYLRLHGRDPESWEHRDEQRPTYHYPPEELRTIASAAQRLAARARKVFVMFNNCHGGKAFQNALQLRELLEQQKNDRT